MKKICFILALIIALAMTALNPATAKKKEKKPEKPLTIKRIVGVSPNHNYDLSPDGKSLLFVTDKGGFETVFKMKAKGGVPRQITGQMQSFTDPRWSPDGKKITCISKKQIWIMDADGSKPKQLTTHGAGAKQARWSPDGKKIAYYTRRKGWSQIWLMDPDGENKRQIIKIANDFNGIGWSPDGKYVLASTTDHKDLYDSHVYLFSIDGKTAKRLTPKNNAYDWDARFTKDGKYIVFLSNRNGWDHLYRMDTHGKNVVQLSKGNYEHENPFPSPNSKYVAYLRDNKCTRQLMVVDVNGGAPVRIDNAHLGINFIESWTPDSKKIYAQFASPMEPWGLWVYSATGRSRGEMRQIVSSFSQGLNRKDFPKPEYVSYKARDGLTIHAYLIKPKNMKKGKKYPAVIYSHGGPTWQFGYRWYPFLAFLAQEGYVVLGPNIRGSTGYGVAFQKKNDGQWGNKDMLDLVDGKKFLSSLDYVDPKRVAIYGGSYGGYMTLISMSRKPGVFNCGVALYGDSDITESYKHGDRPGRLDLRREMGDPDSNKEIYKKGSPVFHAENITDPILIQHGKLDMRVVPLMSKLMIEKLKIEGKFYKATIFEDEPHGFYKPENELKSLKEIYEFLEKYCKGKSKTESDD